MTAAVRFFLPGVLANKQEEAYSALAKLAGRPTPSADSRIYSITYRHDGGEWTATVGEKLRGHTVADPRARAKKRRTEKPLGDSAVVVAIFPGVPFLVFTDSGHGAGSRSAWENPFMAGQPTSVTYFAHGD
jgi:hypothetical protein